MSKPPAALAQLSIAWSAATTQLFHSLHPGLFPLALTLLPESVWSEIQSQQGLSERRCFSGLGWRLLFDRRCCWRVRKKRTKREDKPKKGEGLKKAGLKWMFDETRRQTAALMSQVFVRPSRQTGGSNDSTKRNERFKKNGTFAQSVAAGPKRATHMSRKRSHQQRFPPSSPSPLQSRAPVNEYQLKETVFVLALA